MLFEAGGGDWYERHDSERLERIAEWEGRYDEGCPDDDDNDGEDDE